MYSNFNNEYCYNTKCHHCKYQIACDSVASSDDLEREIHAGNIEEHEYKLYAFNLDTLTSYTRVFTETIYNNLLCMNEAQREFDEITHYTGYFDLAEEDTIGFSGSFLYMFTDTGNMKTFMEKCGEYLRDTENNCDVKIYIESKFAWLESIIRKFGLNSSGNIEIINKFISRLEDLV